MYAKFVWWLYSVVYGNDYIEREKGDQERFEALINRYNMQRMNWARMFNTSVVQLHPQTAE